MAGPRPEKVAVVEEVREHLANSDAAILTEYRGLKVGDLATLRRQLRTAGADYKIFKNTLVRRATAGTDRAVARSATSKGRRLSPLSATTSELSRRCSATSAACTPSSIVKGGLLGTKLVDAQGAGALADLPSRELLLAQLAGAMAAPMRQFAGLLQALPRSFAYGLSALIDKRGGITLEPAAATEAEAPAGETASQEAAPAETAEVIATETPEPQDAPVVDAAQSDAPTETASQEAAEPASGEPADAEEETSLAPQARAAEAEGAEASPVAEATEE